MTYVAEHDYNASHTPLYNCLYQGRYKNSTIPRCQNLKYKCKQKIIVD